MPNSSVKDERQYKALRREGASKEKAARIANASAGSSRSVFAINFDMRWTGALAMVLVSPAA